MPGPRGHRVTPPDACRATVETTWVRGPGSGSERTPHRRCGYAAVRATTTTYPQRLRPAG